MRSIESYCLLERSCITLVLLLASGPMIAEPLGGLKTYGPSAGRLLFANTAVGSGLLASGRPHVDQTSELLRMRTVRSDSYTAMQRVWAASQYGEVLAAQTPPMDVSPPAASSKAEADAHSVPESSTLFLFGLGLVGLAQVPVRKFAKRLPSSRESLMAGTEGVSPAMEIPVPISRTLPTSSDSRLEA